MTAVASLDVGIVYASLGDSELTARRKNDSEDWAISFRGIEEFPFGKIQSSVGSEHVKAAMLRFLAGIE